MLHGEVFAELSFGNVDEWKQMMSGVIPEKQYGYLEFQASSFAGLALVPPEELQQKYEEVCQRIEAHGLSLERDSDVARQLIAQHIAEFFVVSPAVIRRRLEYDGLWD